MKGTDHANEALIAELTASKKTTWIGAISFEERCIGSLGQLARTAGRLQRIVALDYSTSAVPEADAEARREAHWELMEGFSRDLQAESVERQPVSAYSFAEGDEIIARELLRERTELVIIDVTCLTKIHAVAAGACLSRLAPTTPWVAAYSSPRSFCDLVSMDRRFGWRDILIVPLAEGAGLYNEASSRGLILLGHEHDRLVVGLRELQPAGGTIVLPWEPARPDLRYVMERNNRYVLKELAPRPGVGWHTRQIEVGDVSALQKIARGEVALAKKAQAPIILFPMGPKLMVFWAAQVIASEHAAGGWLVYPVPGGYDPDYSDGIERTIWMAAEWSKAVRCTNEGIGTALLI